MNKFVLIFTARKDVLQTRHHAQQLKHDFQRSGSSGPISVSPQLPIKVDMIRSKQDLRDSQDDDDEEDEPDSKRSKLGGSKQEITLAIPDPKHKDGVVLWKFFNPGNRTFLELVGGKLQIIGSRRIQMLIESVPPGSKFITAHLYVQKNDNFEVIEYCTRCKENGIPNIFCILPRRGREHDYPWVTFRITCTSTAKHWRGSLFWIGAEFVLDPVTGNITKFFSPPMYQEREKVGSKKVRNLPCKFLTFFDPTFSHAYFQLRTIESEE